MNSAGSAVGFIEGVGVVYSRQFPHQPIRCRIDVGPFRVVSTFEKSGRACHGVVSDELNRIGDIVFVGIAAIVAAETYPDYVRQWCSVCGDPFMPLQAGAWHAVADLQAWIVAAVKTEVTDCYFATDIDGDFDTCTAVDERRNAEFGFDHFGVFYRCGFGAVAVVLRHIVVPYTIRVFGLLIDFRGEADHFEIHGEDCGKEDAKGKGDDEDAVGTVHSVLL